MSEVWSVRVCARVFPPPMAKRAQESLDIYTGIPLKRVEGGAREPCLFFPLFMSQCQSNQKICLLRTSQSPAALASARGRPLSSPDARGALSSPHHENQGGLAAITALIPSPDLFAFNAEYRLFLSPCLSLSYTLTLRSFAPALPFALWGKAIVRNSSPSGKQPLPRTFPGSRRFRVSKVEELLGRFRAPPSSARKPPVFRLLAHRSQLVPSRRLCAESN